MKNETGFLFDIKISQQDMVNFDLDLDFNDMAIYALFISLNQYKGASIMTIDEVRYTMFTKTFIIKHLPKLGIKSKSAIAQRLGKLVSAGMLVPYQNNQIESISFYRYGAVHDLIISRNFEKQQPLEGSANDTPYLSDGKPPYRETDKPPYRENGNNNNTLTKEDNFNNKKEREDTPAFFSKKIDDLKEQTNPPKKERKGRGTLETYLQFVKLSKDEHAQFTEKYGAKFVEDCIEKLDNWIDRQTGAAHEKYLKQNHAACFRAWVIKAVNEDMEKAAKRNGSFNGSSNRITSSQAVNLD